jgi:8-oxo-dGTP pyrophosphatase MutT (NUDIX family)
VAAAREDGARKGARSESSAGGVVYRRAGGRTEIVLGHQVDWNTGEATVRLPKGHIDPGESPEQAAVREVREEVGRRARIRAPLGEYLYQYVDHRDGHRVAKRVVYYLMEDVGEATDDRDDEMHRVEWVPIETAGAQLTFDNERDVVARAAEALQSSNPR